MMRECFSVVRVMWRKKWNKSENNPGGRRVEWKKKPEQLRHSHIYWMYSRKLVVSLALSACETSSVAQLRTRAPPSDRRLWSCIARAKSQSFPLAASLFSFFGALAFRSAPYPVPSLSYSSVFWHASRLRFNYRSVFTATTTTGAWALNLDISLVVWIIFFRRDEDDDVVGINDEREREWKYCGVWQMWLIYLVRYMDIYVVSYL